MANRCVLRIRFIGFGNFGSSRIFEPNRISTPVLHIEGGSFRRNLSLVIRENSIRVGVSAEIHRQGFRKIYLAVVTCIKTISPVISTDIHHHIISEIGIVLSTHTKGRIGVFQGERNGIPKRVLPFRKEGKTK